MNELVGRGVLLGSMAVLVGGGVFVCRCYTDASRTEKTSKKSPLSLASAKPGYRIEVDTHV